MKTDDIRRLFIDFFRSKGHEAVSSDSLVPKDDPTLLFTGAGMNQFKEKFMGRNITYRRATTSQKCLRTGDLENVGRTTGHHTFFEMLGNFSFGDYFKKEAITWAWEFLTAKLKIEPKKLWVSVYKDDQEAFDIWKGDIRIPDEKIVKFGEKDNFWPSEAPTKGPNGPCGPCSEIFFDYGEDIGCGKQSCTPACDCGRFVEVWNLVFTQFDRQADGKLRPLPNKNIDTGMGLERLASVMQGVKTNFDIDIFRPITEEIEKLIDHRPQTTDHRPMVNAIADHIRAVTFCIADGAMPSNEERGYVVRKLIRRSMIHAGEIGIRKPFLYKLIPVVADVMKAQYPELVFKRENIAEVVKKEEDMFLTVLSTQVPRVEEAFDGISKTKDASKIAELAFNFYDTYGMPYDMLGEIAGKYSLVIDKDAFEKLLDRQRQMSRSKSKIKGEIFSETFSKKIELLGLKTEFLGYERSSCDDAKVIEVLEGREVITDKTPFYGESGGQAGDCGTIETVSGKMKVRGAKKIGDTIVHIGNIVSGSFEKGQTARLYVDQNYRKMVMLNHTATHLLHSALRKVLGAHVHQTGSLVDAEHLRFDFSHIKKVDDRELARIEELVNEIIVQAIPVKKETKDIDAARSEGAIALFGEKYNDKVRVVTIGEVSKELCGGTHLDNTGQIEIFKITSESSVASGVRRIEALTGEYARRWIVQRKEAEKEKERQDLEKKAIEKAQESLLKDQTSKIDSFISNSRTVSGIKIVIETVNGLEMDGLRRLGDRIREKAGPSVILLVTRTEHKASFVVYVTEDIHKKGLSAGDIAKKLAQSVDGSGGGKDLFAQGGGKAPSKLEGALDEMRKSLEEKLK